MRRVAIVGRRFGPVAVATKAGEDLEAEAPAPEQTDIERELDRWADDGGPV